MPNDETGEMLSENQQWQPRGCLVWNSVLMNDIQRRAANKYNGSEVAETRAAHCHCE